MARMLSDEQVARYHRENFLSPLDAMSPARARRYRDALETYEAAHGGPPLPAQGLRKTHVLLPWAADLVRESRILDAVQDVIGPDILVFNSTFFIKEPHSDAVTEWHQDATHFGLTPHEHVTAWVALSPAGRESGCMEMVVGSSKLGQLRHRPHASARSINAGSQSIDEPVNPTPVAHVALEPGQFSLHHTLVVHSSQANRSADRRIGLGISYIPTRVAHTGSLRMSATLARGADRYGHFNLEPDPRSASAAEAAAAHDAAYRRYREGYDEQILRHRAAYTDAPGAAARSTGDAS